MRNVLPSYLFALSNLGNVFVKYIILIKKKSKKKEKEDYLANRSIQWHWLFHYYTLSDGSWKLQTKDNVRYLYLSKLAQIEWNKFKKAILQLKGRHEWPQRLLCRPFVNVFLSYFGIKPFPGKIPIFSLWTGKQHHSGPSAQARFSSFLVCFHILLLRSLELPIEPMISIANDFFLIDLCTLFLGRGWAVKILFRIEKEG